MQQLICTYWTHTSYAHSEEPLILSYGDLLLFINYLFIKLLFSELFIIIIYLLA